MIIHVIIFSYADEVMMMSEKKVVRYKLVRHKWPDEIEAEKKQRKRRIGIIALCVIFFFSGYGLNRFLSRSDVTNDKTFAKLSEVYTIMKNKFYFGKDKEDFNEQLINGAIKGMVDAGGDQHTMYLNNEQSESFTSSMEGSVVGIGVTMYALDDNTFIISDIIKDSPAEKAGLHAGDQIYAVDGKVLKNTSTEEVAKKVKGESGTKVKLEIIRSGKHIEKTITRKKVNGTVFSEIKGDTAKIELTTFAETSGDEFGRHLEDINKAKVKHLIIDLRDNSGGYLKAALQIASYLMQDDQVIFKEDDHDGNITEYKTLNGYEHYTFDKLLILVNGGTASASEALTAALKEQAQAIVIGEKTYGKGTVQIPLPFKDGSMLKYTTGEWITPKGNKLNKVGITPDIKVAQEAAYVTGMPQLDKEEFAFDTVNEAASPVQIYLKFLGYAVDRTDAYFSYTSAKALTQYQKDHELKEDGKIREEVCRSLVSDCLRKWRSDPYKYDLQLKKAMEIANEK